jgi:anaerobic selenocysteine-containing dehydrogenase
VRKLPEFSGELPVVTLAEEILTEGPGQIKALVTAAGNPVLSTPNGRQLDRALAGLEFMVAIDPYINESTRHAHIILPPSSSLERGHYDVAFNLLAVRNTARFSPALFHPDAETRHDWEIFAELQTRMEHGGVSGRVRRSLIRRFLGPERILDLGLRFGPYGAKANPFSKGLTLRKLKKAVHGIDLGPLLPCLPDRLRTPDKQIELAPGVLVKDVERVKAKLLHTASLNSNGNLLLIGRRQLRSNNSWMHNSQRLVRGKPQCTLLMHPADAARRQLRAGQEVSVSSRVGTVVVPIEISEEMMPGVVSIPHGWGHERADVTDDLAIDALCGTAAFNGIWVAVEAHAKRNREIESTDYAH